MNLKNRLKKRWVIKKVLKKGKTLKTLFFICKYLKSPLDETQCCTTISSKVASKANIRNRLQRRTKEALRFNLNIVKTPHNIIILPNKKMLDLDFTEINKNIIHVLEQIAK